MAKVSLFQNINYAGDPPQQLPIGRYDVAAGTLTGNDSVSSVRVPEGLVARLYEHSWFQGRYVDIAMDTPALPMFWNDRTSSVIVYAASHQPPVVTEVILFEHASYPGASQVLAPGRYQLAEGELNLPNDSLSSALVPRGLVLRLYKDAGFAGAFVDFAGDVEALSPEWNDSVSSIAVFVAPPGFVAQSTLNAGLVGESTGFNGVRGISHAEGHGAVVGVNDNNTGNAGPGVYGQSDGTGVWGQSKLWMGVYGNSQSTTGGAGVFGEGNGTGVWGQSKSTTGGAGVFGEGVGPAGIGIFGRGQKLAGYFEGGVAITGDLAVTGNCVITGDFACHGLADITLRPADPGPIEPNPGYRPNSRVRGDGAEEFDIAGLNTSEPGTVMVVGEKGALSPSQHAYDKRVAGVISGAGDYKPGIVLDKKKSASNRQPIALLGKVFCKVDATYGAIEVGDLLTTSDSAGHAMKTDDPFKAFGSVIGKALRPLKEGRGLIPVLIALQ
jgi:hypothetical protein